MSDRSGKKKSDAADVRPPTVGEPSLLMGDCLSIMRGIPTASVDMILCDLPYGTTRNRWDSVLPLDRLWAEYRRIARPEAAIVLTAQTPFDKVLGVSNLKELRYEWIWCKRIATSFLNAKRAPLKKHENILVFSQKPPPYFPRMTEGTPYRIGRCSGTRALSNYGAFDNDKREHENDGKRYPTSLLDVPLESGDRGLHPTQKRRSEGGQTKHDRKITETTPPPPPPPPHRGP